MQKYPWMPYSFTDRTDAHFWTVAAGDKMWQLRWKAESFVRAMGYLNVANSLARTGKLETETKPRPSAGGASPQEMVREILTLCQQARDELALQIKSTYSSQENLKTAIRNDVTILIEGRYTGPVTSEQQQKAITDINKHFETYRKDFSALSAKIESIIEYGSKVLPKGQAYPWLFSVP